MIYRREDVYQLGFSCPYDEVSSQRLVLTIDAFVEQLDLQALHARYSEAGTGYYDPGMLLKVWFFAYCDRSWHCREVAQRVCFDVRYRYFVGSHRPDFRTLNRFRKDHLDLLPGYFAALVSHCEGLGLIDSSVVALDGTKLRANASGRKRGKPGLIEAISDRLEQDAAADESAEPGAVRDAAPVVAVAPPTPVVSGTDPEARLMKTGEGTIRLCYNAQLVVDQHQMIIAAAVSDHADDKSSLPPLLEQAQTQVSGGVGAIVADGGYYSGGNVQYAARRGFDIYVPKGADRRGVFPQELFTYEAAQDRFRCPQGEWLTRRGQRRHHGLLKTTYGATTQLCRACPLKAQCTRGRSRTLEVSETYAEEQALATKLASAHGRAVYARRRELVEPVFGHLKFNLGFTRFSLRGLANVRGEFLLLCIAHNLKKLAQGRSYRRALTAMPLALGLLWTCLNRFWVNFPTLKLTCRKIALLHQ